MKEINIFIYKLRKILFKIFSNFWTLIIFKMQSVEFKKFSTIGIPFLVVYPLGKFKIGNGFKMNNGFLGNTIGVSKCSFTVLDGANLEIGDNVGISSVIISVHKSVFIGDNVKLGAGTCIYDSDFHSLDYMDRRTPYSDKKNSKSKEVFIDSDVFVGAGSTILKGVNIGKNSIIGAQSVVSRDIPSNEIWAGNPARFLRKIS